MADKPEFTVERALERMRSVADEIARVGKKSDEEFVAEDRDYLDKLEHEYNEMERFVDKQRREALVRRVDYRTQAPLQATAGADLDDDPGRDPRSAENAPLFRDPWAVEERMFSNPQAMGAEYKARAKSAIEKMAGTNDRRREVMTRMIEQYDTDRGELSQHLLATSSPAYMRAFVKTWWKGQDVGMLPADEQAAFQRAMSTTTTAGGFLIPQQLDPSVILTSDGSVNQVRNHFRQVVATGNVWNGVATTEASWSVDAEGAEVSDDATTFANPQVSIYKMAGFIPISIEALEDEANVTTEIGRILAMGKDTLESQLFVTGTGSSQHTGLVGTAALSALSSQIVTSATTDTFAIADVYAIDGALPARYRPRAGWFSHRKTQNLIRQFDTYGGAAIWADNLRDNAPGTIFGRPSYEAEAMDGVITGSGENYMLLFADSEAFVIADRVGMTVEPIQHLFSNTTTRPSGQRGFYAYARSGCNWVNVGGARLLNVT